MTRIEILREFLKVWREGQYYGDLAVLRAGLELGSFNPTPQIRAILDSRDDVPDFSAFEFERMPPGSLGQAYGRFLKRNKLKPLRFSNRYSELIQKHKLVVHYTSVHDIFHVLTGYNTTLAGEAGVWAFVEGQDVSPQARTAVKMAKLLYPIVRPSQFKLIRIACREGREKGAAASSLLKVDFKREFERPLAEVRARLGVVPTKLTPLLDPALA